MTMTALSSLLNLGGSGYVVRLMRPLSQSGTVVSPITGKALLAIVAPAGSGAIMTSTYGAAPRLVTGGGAGEIVYDMIDVLAGDAIVASIGAPGATVTTTNNIVQGNDGGNTVVTGPNGYSCTAIGGKKGVAVNGVTSASGGAGGSGGTGGTARAVRYAGGRGGNITGAPATANIATGGGAANPMGLPGQTGTRGGDFNGGPTGIQATGGGGVGGNGGDISGGTFVGGTGGGGAGGPAPGNGNTAGPNIRGELATASPADIVAGLANFGMDYFGGGSNGTNAGAPSVSGPGGGGGGSGVSTGPTNGGASKGLGGSGAASSAGASNSGACGIGGGSGGSLGNPITAPAGGIGFVVVMIVERVD